MKNDMEMQQDVLAALGRDGTLVPGAIGVEVHHGVIKLAGRVSDTSMRERSRDIARGVDGVTSVLLDIDVGPAAIPTHSSAAKDLHQSVMI